MHSLIHTQQLGETILSIDSNNEFIAAGSLSGVVSVWKVEDIKSFSEKPFYQGQVGRMGVSDCKLDPEGIDLYTSTLEGNISKRHMGFDGEQVTEIAVDLMSQWKIDVNGDTILTCGQQGKINIYQKSSITKLSEIKAGDNFLNCIYKMKDGRMLSAGDSEGNLVLVNLKKQNKIVKFPTHNQIIRNIKIIQNQFDVITVSDDGLIKIFNVDKQQQYLNLSQHNGAITSLDIHPKQDHLFITAGLDKTIRIWDLRQKTTATKYQLGSQIWSIKYWKTGRTFMVGLDDGNFSVYSL